MAITALVGGLISGGLSYLGAKKQTEANERAQFAQMLLSKQAAKTLGKAYSDLIARVEQDPEGYAGRKVVGQEYRPVDLAQSQRASVGGNLGNLDLINQLVSGSNTATLQNDFARMNRIDPNFISTLQNLGGAANELSAGQLPFDAIEDIISDRSSRAAAFGTPGGSAPTTLRDLGLSSLDARRQGADLMQRVLQGAEGMSPISRQIASPQFFFTPGQGLQLDMQQAMLDQQSRQNIENLAAAPDPGKSMLGQLGIQKANQQAAAWMGQASMIQPDMTPYSQIYGQIGNAINQGIQGAFGSPAMGGGSYGSGFSQGFGGGFNPAAHNAYAVNYNQNLSSGQAPKAYVVN